MHISVQRGACVHTHLLLLVASHLEPFTGGGQQRPHECGLRGTSTDMG